MKEAPPNKTSRAPLFTNGSDLSMATMLGVVAHPDDIELGMPWAPLSAISRPGEGFAGITCTDGADGYRASGYEDFDAQEFAAIRREEQAEAARVGGYVAQVQLGIFESHEPSAKEMELLRGELTEVMAGLSPRGIFTHSLFDRHPWHRAVAIATVRACRDLALAPKEFLGVEIWGGLDWMGRGRVAIPHADNDGFTENLVACYRSQQAHTPYGEAAAARRFANGTYHLGREIGVRKDITYAMDLAPLLDDPNLGLREYCSSLVTASFAEVLSILPAATN